ncbi:MAG: hypothetical protein ABIG84_08580 [archaeon]
MLTGILIVWLQAHASTFTELIYSQKLHPETATVGDDFAICVLTNKVNPCRKETIQIKYRYFDYSNPTNYVEGYLHPLRDYIRNEHFMIDEMQETDIWCANAVGSLVYKNIVTTFTCLDNLGEEHYDTDYKSIYSGSIVIHPTSKFEEGRLFGTYVGNKLNITTYLDDPDGVNMYYSLYNITLGIPYLVNEKMDYIEGQFADSFNISADAPLGFIEIIAEGQGTFGAKFISYAAIPYNSIIDINGQTIMGNKINIDLDIDLKYGKINNAKTVIILPNKTQEKIYLDHVNTSVNYTIPMRPGNYTIETTINHSVLQNEKTTKQFTVREYELDLGTDKGVYVQGETVIINVGVIDSSRKAIDFEVKSIKIKSPTGAYSNYDNGDTKVENNYHKLEYKLKDDADIGMYTVDVEAKDKYGLSYSGNASFAVNELDRSVLFLIMPSILNVDINSMNRTTRGFMINNTGINAIDDISIIVEPLEMRKYFSINMTEIPSPLDPGNSSPFSVTINPEPDMQNRLYYANISVTAEADKKVIVPVTLDVSLSAEMTIINKTVSSEALKDKMSEIYITIQNAGTRPLANISASISGALSDHKEDIVIPNQILPDSKGNIIIKFKPIADIGEFDGEVDIGGENVTNGKAEITLNVVEDKKYDIDQLETERLDMNRRMEELKDAGINTDTVKTDLEDLQADINEIRSRYNNGQYAASYSMLTEIKNRAKGIDDDIKALEATKTSCGDGKCDAGETCSSCFEDCKIELSCEDTGCNNDGVCDDKEDCTCGDCEFDDKCAEPEPTGEGGGISITLIIAIIIVVVIIAAVVATSIVPDNEEQNYGPASR